MGRRSKQTVLQRRHTDGQKPHEKMLNITNYERNANQTTMRHHLTAARMAIIKKSTNSKCWRGYGEKGTLLQCWWECKLVQLLWKTVWSFLKKLKIPIPLLSIYLEKTMTRKYTCTPMFIAVPYTLAKT
uniref:Uncharacterized protein n=1 Tax=Sus scrofa TaxID=9823 RepID=A0A8D1ZZR6_PIG